MSIDRNFSLAIGYEVVEADLAPLAEVLPEVSHMEDRFDPKTGNKLDPVKVVDQGASTLYSLLGQELWEEEDPGDRFPSDFESVCRKIAKQVECQVEVYGNAMCDDLFAVFGPALTSQVNSILQMKDDQVDVDPPRFYAEVVSAANEVQRIGAALGELGIDCGPALVGVGQFVS